MVKKKDTGGPADQAPLDSANDSNPIDGPEPRTVSSLNIHQRINAVMADLHYIKKNKVIKNKKGEVMYSVVGHDDVTGLIHPMLVKHGINIIPTFISLMPEVLKIDYYGKEGFVNRERLDVKFTWVNIDDPTDFMEQLWTAYGCDDSDKGPGKAISYAQRYAEIKTLLSFFSACSLCNSLALSLIINSIISSICYPPKSCRVVLKRR